MTAPKSCSNCGAAPPPALATSPVRPGVHRPAVDRRPPLRPGAGSPWGPHPASSRTGACPSPLGEHTRRGSLRRRGPDLPRDAHPDARDSSAAPWPSSDCSAETNRNRAASPPPPAFSSPAAQAGPVGSRGVPQAGCRPLPSLVEAFAEHVQVRRPSVLHAGGTVARNTKKGAACSRMPRLRVPNDGPSWGCYSASAPPARRIASVTMPTLVTPAPLAASITSMISP